MSLSDIDHSVMISAVAHFETTVFKAKFTSFKLYVEKFSELVETAAVPATKKPLERMDLKVSQISSALKPSGSDQWRQ